MNERARFDWTRWLRNSGVFTVNRSGNPVASALNRLTARWKDGSLRADPGGLLRLSRRSTSTLRRLRCGRLSALGLCAATAWLGVAAAEPVKLAVTSVTASADDGNVPSNTLDGSLNTRWSAEGDGQWIQYDLGATQTVSFLRVAFHQGNQRTADFEILTSGDGTAWNTVFTGASSGATLDLESYDFSDTPGRYVRVVGHGNSASEWNSVTEVEILGLGTGPMPPQFQLTSVVPAGSTVTLQWNCLTNAVYQVQVSSNFSDWNDAGPSVTNAAGPATWVDTNSPSAGATPSRFYRVKQLPGSQQPPGDPLLPSEVLDLTDWKLTLPVNTSHAGSPDEFLQPELDGFQNTNFFKVNATRDGVVFTAPCGGATTSGSGYPRSELREMTGSGLASWSTTSGIHTMVITQAITHLPEVKPHVVAGQIHDADDDVIVFRLEGSKLFVDENGNDGPVLTSNYQLGDVFTVKFVARNGGIECHYNGQYIYTYQISTSGCYFKAGCYTQSNTSRGDAPTAYGEVIIYGLSVTHE